MQPDFPEYLEINSKNNNKTFGLNHLLKPFDFSYDPADRIKDVKIISFRLKPYNDSCDLVIRVPKDNKNKTIYDLVKYWFDFNDPFIKIFVIKEVEIAIEFFDEGKKISKDVHFVKVKHHGDYILSKNSKQKEPIIAKYLKYWNLIK